MINFFKELAIILYNGFCETVKFILSIGIIGLITICIIAFVYIVIDTTIYYIKEKKSEKAANGKQEESSCSSIMFNS